MADIFHTFFGISGLSLLGYFKEEDYNSPNGGSAIPLSEAAAAASTSTAAAAAAAAAVDDKSVMDTVTAAVQNTNLTGAPGTTCDKGYWSYALSYHLPTIAYIYNCMFTMTHSKQILT